MNAKKIWFVIPTVLIPYVVLFLVLVALSSTDVPFFNFIIESVCKGNGLYLLAAILIYGALSAVLMIVCFILSICKGWNAFSLAKSAMIVKMVQVPAYVVIFVLGILFAITIFTTAVAFIMFLFNCLTLFLTGLLTTAAVTNSVRQDVFKLNEVAWVIFLQFVFCADVVASIIFYAKLKKAKAEMQKSVD